MKVGLKDVEIRMGQPPLSPLPHLLGVEEEVVA